jgi:hypothetical protein
MALQQRHGPPAVRLHQHGGRPALRGPQAQQAQQGPADLVRHLIDIALLQGVEGGKVLEDGNTGVGAVEIRPLPRVQGYLAEGLRDQILIAFIVEIDAAQHVGTCLFMNNPGFRASLVKGRCQA